MMFKIKKMQTNWLRMITYYLFLKSLIVAMKMRLNLKFTKYSQKMKISQIIKKLKIKN